MVVFAITGVAFILASLFTKSINASAGQPYPLKWYHRLIGICIGVVSMMTAIRLYEEH